MKGSIAVMLIPVSRGLALMGSYAKPALIYLIVVTVQRIITNAD